jgi:hypothetical protein
MTSKRRITSTTSGMKGERGGRDRAEEHQLEALPRSDGIGERAARADPRGGEEDEDAELAQHEVGGVRQLECRRTQTRDNPEDQPGDQRPTTGAEVELGTARHWDGDRPDAESDGDADGKAGGIELEQAPL